jgi:hypothetical protein
LKINMEHSQSFNESRDTSFKNGYQNDIRNSMCIESVEQDKYIDILCNLFDESVQYNDSKQVIHCMGLFFVRMIIQYLTLGHYRENSQGPIHRMRENESASRHHPTSSESQRI